MEIQSSHMDFVELDRALPSVLIDLIFEYIPCEIYSLAMRGKICSINHFYDLIKSNFQLVWECIEKKLFVSELEWHIFYKICKSVECNIPHLKYLYYNKFPYDRTTFAGAAITGNLDNMKWLLEMKFPYDMTVFRSAVSNGNLANMKWLYDNKFPHDKWTFTAALLKGDPVNLKWMIENNFPAFDGDFWRAKRLIDEFEKQIMLARK